MKKSFISENCIYWIKPMGFKKYIMAIFSQETEEFRTVNNKLPTKTTTKYKKEDLGSYIIAMDLKTEME